MPPSPALTVSVDNLADWQLQPVLAEQLSDTPTAEHRDFWLRPPTLAYLLSDDLPLKTEVMALTHTPTQRRVLLTAQTFTFTPEAQVSEAARGKSSRWQMRRRLLAPFPIKTLCIGQLLTSGEHATEGLTNLPPAVAARLVGAVGNTLLRRRPDYQAILLKDLSTSASALAGALRRGKFNSLPAEPVMIMDLRPFPTFDTYLASLSSKYRVRYRRARGKLDGVSSRSLPSAEVSELLPQIFSLYEQTRQGADFNVTPLTPGYFRWLATVGRYRGYFDDTGWLIGFTTAVANGTVYQAHFLGLREAAKYENHLYHNMLFDLLEAAIVGGFTTLDYGRTATEIKSSIGAEPVAYSNLLRLRSALLNALVPYFIPTVFTAKAWQPRNPFRQ